MTQRRRTALLRQSGPYKVQSYSDGSLLVTPAWPQGPVWTADDGGGPGVVSRLELAHQLELWLNAPFSEVTP